jgi:uncharacterized protein YbjT (DUF2867 family)
MTVAVIGGSGLIGRATLRRLIERDPDVRALVRNPAAADGLRALGVKVAVGDVGDETPLDAVVGGAHTVFHVAGSVNEPAEAEYRRANVDSVERVVSAAERSRAQRVVLVSHAGAFVDAASPFLRTMALAEETVLASALQGVVLRTATVYGIGGVWFTCVVNLALDDPPSTITGDGDLRPTFVDDLAAVLASIDDRPEELRGRWGLDGLDGVTGERLASMLRGDDLEIRPLAPVDAAARLEALLGRPVSPWACRLFADRSPSTSATVPDAASAFGVDRTPLADGLRATATHASAARLEG